MMKLTVKTSLQTYKLGIEVDDEVNPTNTACFVTRSRSVSR